MNLRLIAMLAALGILLVGCENRAKDDERRFEELSRKIRSHKATRHPLVGAVRSATAVTAHRVDEIVNSDGSRRFQVRPVGVQVDYSEQQRLASAVETIDFDPLGELKCFFEPGVEYRFPAGGKELGFQVCFKCNEVKFVGDGGEALSRKVPFRGAENVELLRITKTLFPKEPEIQALK